MREKLTVQSAMALSGIQANQYQQRIKVNQSRYLKIFEKGRIGQSVQSTLEVGRDLSMSRLDLRLLWF